MGIVDVHLAAVGLDEELPGHAVGDGFPNNFNKFKGVRRLSADALVKQRLSRFWPKGKPPRRSFGAAEQYGFARKRLQ
jgi:hypothetical protein